MLFKSILVIHIYLMSHGNPTFYTYFVFDLIHINITPMLVAELYCDQVI